MPRRCAPRNDVELGIDFFPYHVILKIKRGAAGRREPPFTKRSNRTVGTVGRLLLFIVVNMDEQSQNAHDELTDQDQFRMSHHMYHLPPRKRRLYKRSVASSRRRGLPPTEYWQRQRISMRRGYYSTFCRIWQGVGSAPKGGGILPSPRPPCLPPWGRCPRRGRMRVGLVGAVCSRKSLSSVTASPRHLPPRVGKAKENPPAGDGSPRRCAPRNDGELGIDKRWEAGIMKIKRGAAGRLEPLRVTKK